MFSGNLQSPKTITIALRVPLFSLKLPSQFPKFQSHSFRSSSNHFLINSPTRVQISSKKSRSDAELASDFASEVEKLNTHLVQREEAMRKSKEMLFTELCRHMRMKDGEVKKKWKKMSEDDKWGLVKEFVLKWGDNFHPLSAKSVKEMVDEYLVEDNPSSDSSSASMLFPNLLKFMGFSENK